MSEGMYTSRERFVKKMPDKRIGDPRLRGDDKMGGALLGVRGRAPRREGSGCG